MNTSIFKRVKMSEGKNNSEIYYAKYLHIFQLFFFQQTFVLGPKCMCEYDSYKTTVTPKKKLIIRC